MELLVMAISSFLGAFAGVVVVALSMAKLFKPNKSFEVMRSADPEMMEKLEMEKAQIPDDIRYEHQYKPKKTSSNLSLDPEN